MPDDKTSTKENEKEPLPSAGWQGQQAQPGQADSATQRAAPARRPLFRR